MADLADKIYVQIRFKEETEFGIYSDSLFYTQAEYAALSDGAKVAAKQSRVAAYVSGVKNPPAPPVLTKQELQAAKTSLLSEIAVLDAKIATTP